MWTNSSLQCAEIFTTGTTAYDKGIVLLPLAKAQAFSRRGKWSPALDLRSVE